MNTLILNGLSSTPFELRNYNRNTSFDEARNMNSIAYFDIAPTTNTSAQLENIGKNPITNILIKHDDTPIYNLTNLNARISTINETLYDDSVLINASIVF